MRKTNHSQLNKIGIEKSQKKNAENQYKKSSQIQGILDDQEIKEIEFLENFLTKNSNYTTKLNSRTMEWLKIPLKKQLEFRKNLINVSIDYLQYTCYNIQEPIKLLYHILGFDGNIDSDNSNIEYNFNNTLSLLRFTTKMGYAYQIIALFSGLPPVPIASLEIYNEDKEKFLKTQGKIVFYGAYFVFEELISEQNPEVIRFYRFIENQSDIKNLQNIIYDKKSINKNNKNKNLEKPNYKRTRVDIAIDVNQKISQQWLKKYIRPHKNSKHTVKPYNWQSLENTNNKYEGFQSFSYIPKLSQGLSIRIYNKILDIKAKGKTSWYPEYGQGKKYEDVTRIELIFGGDTASDSLENIINYSKYRILGTMQTRLNRPSRPKSEYSPLSAYEYFKRYAKNHGKTLREVLDDVTTICITEEQKDKYDEINEKYNNINNSNYGDIEICSN